MSPRPHTRTVVRTSIRHRVLALVCMGSLALGSAAHSMAAEPPGGLRLVGAEYHAKELADVMDGFAPQPSANLEIQWSVTEPGLKPGDLWKGKMCYSPAELIAHFRSLPASRTARGMFITHDLTHLEDLEASKAQMTNYEKTKLVTDPEWMAAHRKSIQELVAACEKAKIDVWVNVNLGVENLRFRKLTK